MVSKAQKPVIAECFVNILAAENTKYPRQPQHLNCVRGCNLAHTYYPELGSDIPGWDDNLSSLLKSYSNQGSRNVSTLFRGQKMGTYWEYFAIEDTAEYQAAWWYYHQNGRVRPLSNFHSAPGSAQNSSRGRPSSGSGGGPSSGSGGGDRSIGNITLSTGGDSSNN